MAKLLKHFVRVHTLHEERMKSFALIAFDNEEHDSCVTLVRCKADNVKREFNDWWGYFPDDKIAEIEKLECVEQYMADEESLIIRLS